MVKTLEESFQFYLRIIYGSETEANQRDRRLQTIPSVAVEREWTKRHEEVEEETFFSSPNYPFLDLAFELQPPALVALAQSSLGGTKLLQLD